MTISFNSGRQIYNSIKIIRLLNFLKYKRESNYTLWTLFNFFVLAVVGVLLRYMHNFPLPSVNYQFLLHSHSHFAFSGWMFLAISILIVKNYAGNHPNKIFSYLFFATLLVSFGMLVSFFLSGYKTLSIILSTLFVFITYWFVLEVFRQKFFKHKKHILANTVLKGSLIFLVISSFGPFALGYFKASGLGTVVSQQNSLYFYLHFQMNGFMQLALLSLFFRKQIKTGLNTKTNLWAKVFVYATLPLYFIFTLWADPPAWCYVLAFMGAILHLISWLVLVYRLKVRDKSLNLLTKTALLAISIQFFLQILICFPAIGTFVFSSHNMIIGYIHLLTLGSLTPLILDFFIAEGFLPKLKITNLFFVFSVVIYLMLLFGGSFLELFGIYLPNLEMLLFLSNLLFPLIAGIYFFAALRTRKQRAKQPDLSFLDPYTADFRYEN